MSYAAVHATAVKFGLGLRSLGLNSGSKISMFSETRSEWMMSCQGAFSQNIHVCTVYTNLGEEGILHAMNETGAQIVVTSHDLLPKFTRLLEHLPHVTHIIYFEDQLQTTKTNGFRSGVEVVVIS
jgi:long-chain acyl-CoA synthetase